MRLIQIFTGTAIAAFAFGVAGCGSPVVPPATLVINEVSSPVETSRRDPVTILAGRVEGDALTIDVEYGGGCEDHEFSLVGSGVFRETFPVQTDLTLYHDAKGDVCRALVRRTLEFDLTPLKTLYRGAYATGNGIIAISLYAASGQNAPETSFRYEF